MRVAWLVVLAACSPDVVSGSYRCGIDQSCPPDEACDGSADTCVLISEATPFSCMDTTAPDDDPAHATAISGLQCISAPFSTSACILLGDPADWYSVAPPSDCTAVAISAKLEFPIANERLTLELWDLGSMTMLGADIACPPGGDSAHEHRCLTMTVTPGGAYGIAVKPTGQNNCGGSCNYNRYDLSIQLGTP